MILHILGGGPGQLSAVRRCRGLGITTFVTDMNLEAPGCIEADFCGKASTFDAAETAAAARRFTAESGLKIGALLVTGTDQPVLTAALTAGELGIPYFLDPEHALTVTNKKKMKTVLAQAGIPTAPFMFIGSGGGDETRFTQGRDFGLRYPVVTKPLDSQGQRGVYRLESEAEVCKALDEVLGYSRCNEILVEEYYPSDEITLSGWLSGGRLNILSVTDRVTVENPPSIGVCVAHHYPSKYSGRLPEIRRLTERIVSAAGLTDGPVYFQYLVGREGPGGKIIVNEIACRLGGAYEDEFLPFITGVDILDTMIRFSCGRLRGSAADESESCCDIYPGKVVSLQMFFCTEGVISRQSGMEEVLAMKGVSSGRFLLKPGVEIRSRRNSTQRAGYFIVQGSDKNEVDATVRDAYSKLRIDDENGRNMIQFYDKMLFGGNK